MLLDENNEIFQHDLTLFPLKDPSGNALRNETLTCYQVSLIKKFWESPLDL